MANQHEHIVYRKTSDTSSALSFDGAAEVLEQAIEHGATITCAVPKVGQYDVVELRRFHPGKYAQDPETVEKLLETFNSLTVANLVEVTF